MNRERVVAIAVAFACVASMGVASTTLESSLASNPDDAIQLDYDTLPIGREQAEEVKQEVQQNEQNGQAESASADQSDSSSQSKSASSSSSVSKASASASKTDEQSLLDVLIALLKALLPYLVAGLALLTVGGLASRYRQRLIAPFLALLADSGGRDGREQTKTVEWEPRDDIERTWLDLLQRAGVDRPQTKTPTECANDVVAAGYDPEPVHSLRRAFEEVRYGEQSPTDDHREQVVQSRQRLGLGGKP